MWTPLRSLGSTLGVVVAALCLICTLGVSPATAQQDAGENDTPQPVNATVDGAPQTPAPAAPEPDPAAQEAALSADDIIFQGKLYASRKQTIIPTFEGTVEEIYVKTGEQVEENQPLMRYRISNTVLADFRNRVSSAPLVAIDNKIAQVQPTLYEMQVQLREARMLAESDFMGPQKLEKLQTTLELTRKQLESLEAQRRFQKKQLEDQVQILQDYFGDDVGLDKVPDTIVLRAPISGHVLWVNPEFHEGMYFVGGMEFAKVGVMDPMVIRAHLFELEASRVATGEPAVFTLGSFPERDFDATLSSISLTPISPGLDQPSYYEVELTAPNPELLLREGFKVEVIFQK